MSVTTSDQASTISSEGNSNEFPNTVPPTPSAYDTLKDIRWTIFNQPHPTVESIRIELSLGSEWTGVIKSIIDDNDQLGENPIQVNEVSDEIRAALLQEYLQSIQNLCPNPLLMPLDEGKEPKIIGQCKLDSSEADSFLHTPSQAVDAVRNGHTGFALYAGKERHHTENIVLVDHDDLDRFPLDTLRDTLTVRTGSAGFHETFVTPSDDHVANARGDWGEMRSENWYCVLPGSVHKSGGVYHISRLREPSMLSEDAVPERLKPAGRDDNGSENVEIDFDANEGDGYDGSGEHTNLLGVSLQECRERDYQLDQLLSQQYPDYLQGTGDSQSEIDLRLVSKLRYHHFTPHQIGQLWKEHRWRDKLNRTDYVRGTIQEGGTHGDRFTPADYFDDEADSDYIALIPPIPDGQNDSKESSTVSLPDVRKTVRELINNTVAESYCVLIDALPGIGKSYGVLFIPDDTGTPLTVFAHRHDNYNELKEKAENDFDYDVEVIPPFTDACPTMNGDYQTEDSPDWQSRFEWLYNQKGVKAGEIHYQAEEIFGKRPPCDDGHECPWKSAMDFDEGETDVIIGNYVNAHNERFTNGRATAIDEFPGTAFIDTYSRTTVAGAVNDLLHRHDGLPYRNYTDLTENRDDTERAEQARQFLTTEIGIERDTSLLHDSGKSNDVTGDPHPMAPLLTYALLNGDDLQNGFESCELDIGRADDANDGSVHRTAIRNREDGSISILNPPDLSETTGVLALDGTPSLTMWELVLGVEDDDCDDESSGLRHKQILDDDERKRYLTDEHGLTVVQTSAGAKHYGKGTWATPEQDKALFQAATRRSGERIPLISTKGTLEKYDSAGVLGPISETLNYSRVNSSNVFKPESNGFVSGTNYYNPNYFKEWSALKKEPVEMVDGTKGMEREYTTDFGNELLINMREHNVLQAIQRFGRRNDIEPTVYTNTAAIPPWVPVEIGPDDIYLQKLSSGMRETLYAIASIDVESQDGDVTFTTKTVTSRTNVGRKCVLKHLERLVEYDHLSKETEPGKATIWTLEDFPLGIDVQSSPLNFETQ